MVDRRLRPASCHRGGTGSPGGRRHARGQPPRAFCESAGAGRLRIDGRLPVPKDRRSEERSHGIPVTYVPGRNLIFLSLAAAHAEAEGVSLIYFGANVLDYSGYPDCRPEFIRAFEAAVAAGTKAGVEGTALHVPPCST